MIPRQGHAHDRDFLSTLFSRCQSADLTIAFPKAIPNHEIHQPMRIFPLEQLRDRAFGFGELPFKGPCTITKQRVITRHNRCVFRVLLHGVSQH
ncbi:MAG: hypothetical protein ACK5T6_01435, partial [Pirellula sp.]